MAELLLYGIIGDEYDGLSSAAFARRLQEVPPTEDLLVRINSRTAGLLAGLCDVGILRRPMDDPRFRTGLAGVEASRAPLPCSSPRAVMPSPRSISGHALSMTSTLKNCWIRSSIGPLASSHGRVSMAS